MQVLIDTSSSLGMVDYSSCIQFSKQASITRKLNKPTVCTMSLFTGALGLPTPQVLARIVVTNSAGLTLFTGYVSEAPVMHVVGQNHEQPATIIMLTAVSDEILMDADQVSSDMTYLGQSLKLNWKTLALLSVNTLQVAVSNELTASSRFLVKAGSRWSETAGALAAQTNSAYRCISGLIDAISIGQSVHVIAASDPGISFKPFPINDVRWLARDVTVCGREEPTAYVIELFVGDGSTSSFTLTQQPFYPAAAQKTSFLDLFQGTSLNDRLWRVSDPGAHIALTQLGLTCSGGTGRDGEAVVSTLQQIELGGTITLEASGVSLLPGSSGVVLGLYTGDVLLTNCLAGYQVSSAGQLVILTAEVFGSSVGSAYSIEAGHMYTLRLRMYSPEMERLRQGYAIVTSKESTIVGGDTVASIGHVVFEVQDTTSGVAGTTTVLFTGNLSDLPVACILGLINSGNLNCSIRTVRCSQTGPLHVTLGSNATAQIPLSLATSAEGGSCHLTTTGILQFYPATFPGPNQVIAVSYRAKSIAVARRSLPLPSADTNLPATLTWIGTVKEPIAWSSNDCDNVASAILGAVADGMPVLKGSYHSSLVGSDIWPGDVLSIGPQDNGSTLDVVVQVATITLHPDLPEETSTIIEFATSALGEAGFKLSSTISPNVSLPQGPTSVREALDSLKALSFTGVTTSSVTISTGIVPPINGGFEVRRRDFTFGPGVDSDLVLRTAATNISIPRSNPGEEFYIRMYDASQPPNYSQFSAALFINMPIGS